MRRHSWMLAAALAASLVSAGPAFPQPPDAMTAARELVVTMKLADQFRALLPIILQNLKPAITQNRTDVERDFDTILPLLLEGMNARLDDLTEQTAGIYARHFTADELHALTAFYRAPVGQKFLDKLPAVTQESMAMGQKWGQAIAAELQGRIVEELRKRGHKL
ncbi:MAG: uncharacterized protein QOI12_3725 [Alphaproteobacteria bacterium]|nr:uncharacterized protein [Alphaproteobacteria bacterium]